MSELFEARRKEYAYANSLLIGPTITSALEFTFLTRKSPLFRTTIGMITFKILVKVKVISIARDLRGI